MIRFCDGTDLDLVGVLVPDAGAYPISSTRRTAEPCRCRLRFDDEDRSLIYPHAPIQGGRYADFIQAPRNGADFSESSSSVAGREPNRVEERTMPDEIHVRVADGSTPKQVGATYASLRKAADSSSFPEKPNIVLSADAMLLEPDGDDQTA